ncbi:MAG: hypothetical protein LBT20_03515 [Clostridiales bacterium]|nr:hypothetical protein [Clostridiales bacterium]
MYKYTKIYSGGEPELIEGDIFRTIVPLSSEIGEINEKSGEINEKVGEIKKPLSETAQAALAIIETIPNITFSHLLKS